MLRRIALAALAIVLIGVALYALGLRVVMSGGGGPRLSFTRSAQAQADAIARHREAQRAVSSLPQPVTPSPAAAAAGSAETTTASSTGFDAAASWPDFRGALRDGVYRGDPIRTSWPASGLTPAWKEPVGGGYGSIVIARGRAFTIEQRSEEEVVAAYDAATGRELWTTAWPASFRETMGGDGPRATPTWSDGQVYALGATGEFRCLDEATGRTVWRKNILEDNSAGNIQWGMSASPLIAGDTVIVLPGGSGGRSVVAYDRRTGERRWSALDDQAAYASPMLATIAGTPMLVIVTARRMMGLTPESGALLWEFPWTTDYDINASQPLIVGPNRVFISSSYGVGAAVIEVTASSGRYAVREVWRNNRMKNKFASSVLNDGFIYGLDESILACLNAETGELKWKGGRYGYGQIMLAGGHIVVLTEDGDLALVRATPDRHEEVAHSPAISGKTWNHPAMAGGWLFVRNLQEMAAFDLRR